MPNIPQGKYENTIKECTKALELNPVYVKALLRRGEAHEKLEHFEEAIAGELKFYIPVFDCIVLSLVAYFIFGSQYVCFAHSLEFPCSLICHFNIFLEKKNGRYEEDLRD